MLYIKDGKEVKISFFIHVIAFSTLKLTMMLSQKEKKTQKKIGIYNKCSSAFPRAGWDRFQLSTANNYLHTKGNKCPGKFEYISRFHWNFVVDDSYTFEHYKLLRSSQVSGSKGSGLIACNIH